ncbi:NAD(P)/FAD-dependent oxidoreductase [Streptomyces asiaticus]|uniref:NAD(P)/FAD-dependent oxidoreductase n=1 Tax=Streptomyces asiaticus TaxID=114695 RepID=UPI003D7195C8
MEPAHCARVQPAKLVRGLADVVERMGIAVYEGTEVTEIRPRQAVTAHGTVKATYVIRALEGFTAGLRGHRRVWLPMNSSMIVTEPLPASAWEGIGWRGAELIGDEAHSYCYIQRTTDGRIAIGGRGVPYMFGSHVDQRGETKAPTQLQLRAILRQHFPATEGVAIDHAWSGVLGVPRDWCACPRCGEPRSYQDTWARDEAVLPPAALDELIKPAMKVSRLRGGATSA